jgi:hypothetical protein
MSTASKGVKTRKGRAVPSNFIDDNHLLLAAETMCLRLHPRGQKSSYVMDRRAHYSADVVTYVLQALSEAMTSIFYGLLANYLFDTYGKGKQVALPLLVKEHKKELKKLEALLTNYRADPNFPYEVDEATERAHVNEAKRRMRFHNEAIIRIQDSDPRIAEMVEDVMRQLEKRGHQPLSDKFESY